MANELTNLSPPEGAHKKAMRVGRGEGSGKGRSAGRGSKGQRKRSKVASGFEGGQMPLHRRLPKRGFKNIHGKRYTQIDIATLPVYFEDGESVDATSALARGAISKIEKNGIKVLGGGDIEIKLNIAASAFTKSAVSKINSAGGTTTIDSKYLSRRYAVVKIGRINAAFDDGAEINSESLLEKKLISEIPHFGVWVVGGGSCKKAMNITVAKFSTRAANEIVKAGGSTATDERRFGSLVLTTEG